MIERPDLNAISTEPWWQAMLACPQDPQHHAEGGVAVHTRMVIEALTEDPRFADLSDSDQAILAWAALLHDVDKPDTTREEDGRIVSRGHSRRGAILARRILWEMDVPFFTVREFVILSAITCGQDFFSSIPILNVN